MNLCGNEKTHCACAVLGGVTAGHYRDVIGYHVIT